MTGDGLRHRYVAAQIAAQLDLAGVVVEAKDEDARRGPGRATSERDADVLRAHFAQRDEAEARHFGDVEGFPGQPAGALRVARGEVNDTAVAAWVVRHAPDLLLVFGTSVLRAPLLDRYEGRVINLHLGLSPYYRGSGTNFWPLVDDKPECVGATVHLAVREVDAGPILGQARPEPTVLDAAHDLGCKAVIDGAALLQRCARGFHGGDITPRLQSGEGRLCRNADFAAEAVRTVWRNLEGGMMTRYVHDRATRQRRFPIVELT